MKIVLKVKITIINSFMKNFSNISFNRKKSFRRIIKIYFFYTTKFFFFTDVPPIKQVYNPFAIERPHATPSMLERQGSFRGFTQLNQASPFKRQLSLRINDLPSNLERTRSHSLEPTDLSRMPSAMSHIVPLKPPGKDPYCDIFESKNIIIRICIIILFYKIVY